MFGIGLETVLEISAIRPIFRLTLIFLFTVSHLSAQLALRPLDLPKTRPGGDCPVSKGSHDIVPNVPYIFCAQCLWFGTSPVNFAWAYQFGSGDSDAVFDLTGVPHDRSGYVAKTPWVARFDFSGPILIRGRQIDGNGKLRFSAAGPKLQENFELLAADRNADGHWSFWPAEMNIPHTGCYAIQIDTSAGSEVVVFKTVAP